MRRIRKLAAISLALALYVIVLGSCKDDITINVEFKPNPAPPTPRSFVHPGIVHNNESITRMRNVISQQIEPQLTAFQLLQGSEFASASYVMEGPFEIIARGDEYAHTKRPSERDHKAAYQNALMWVCTGNAAHAEKSVEILNAYATTLRQIEPTHNDAPLCASLQGFILVNAAELIRHTYPDVRDSDVEMWENMFRNVFIPVLNTFAGRTAYTNGNWGTAYVKAMMGFGVFLDDEELYFLGQEFYHNANDNGTIANYISETGQCQESGRDQGHTMLGLGHMGEACEIAYIQGDKGEMFEALDNRLMSGYEYTAKYNLGYDDVPFTTWQDVTGKSSNWTAISTEQRGEFRPVFEIAYNHFVTRNGLDMPYTKMVLERTFCPETNPENCDHPGYGTLTFRSELSGEAGEPGFLFHDFSTAIDLLGWEVERGGTGDLVDGKFVITPADQGNGKYRGDINNPSPLVLHPGNFPIVAIKFEIPDVSSWLLTLDTDGANGFFSKFGENAGRSHSIIDLSDGSAIYYWDLTEGEFNVSGPLPTTSPTSFGNLRFKIADIVYNTVGDYRIHWIRTFKSEAHMEAYVN